jgi:hypothetical protein
MSYAPSCTPDPADHRRAGVTIRCASARCTSSGDRRQRFVAVIEGMMQAVNGVRRHVGDAQMQVA